MASTPEIPAKIDVNQIVDEYANYGVWNTAERRQRYNQTKQSEIRSGSATYVLRGFLTHSLLIDYYENGRHLMVFAAPPLGAERGDAYQVTNNHELFLLARSAVTLHEATRLVRKATELPQ
jgi:hypothetical protein